MKERIVTWLRGISAVIRPVHILGAAGLIAFFWLLIMGDQGLYRLRQLILFRSELAAQRRMLAKDIQKSDHERHMLEDPKNLEMIIRKELGYIRPGEIIFQEPESHEDE